MTPTPQQTLKCLPRRKARDARFLDDPSENQVSPEAEIASCSVTSLLAMAIVQDAFSERDLDRVLRPMGTAMVVTVPGPDWIDPIADALEHMGQWGITFRRGAGPKSTEKPSSGSHQVASILSTGLNVLGVSQSPETTLPSALMTVADIRVEVRSPGSRVLRSIIFLVTGTHPRKIPVDAVRGLDFDEIAACIRRGTKAGDCVRRLVAASRSKLSGDTGLSDVPLLQDTFGYAEAATWGLSLATAVAEWRRSERAWASIPDRCAVVAGPPGCGKSTYARTLAKTLGMPIVATSVSAWFGSGGYLDQVLKAVDTAIAQAVAIGPAVLFIDEIDSIPDRNSLETGGRNTQYWTTLVSHILTQLDSAVSGTTSSLVVIGATNYPERLDAALIRPGRLNRVIHIPMPDTDAIAGILRQHLGDDLPGADLRPLAIAGQGASGAEIASWAKGARETAWTARRPMEISDLVARIAPPDTRSPATQKAISLHESGHAASTELLFVGTLESVSIIGRGPYAGRTHAKLRAAEAMSADELDAFVVSILCGRAVDEYWGTATSGAAGGPGSDLAVATSLVAGKHGSYGLGETLTYRGDPNDVVGLIGRDGNFRNIVEADLRRLYRVAEIFVSEHASEIEAIARRLVQSRILSGAEVRSIIGKPSAPRPTETDTLVTVGGVHD